MAAIMNLEFTSMITFAFILLTALLIPEIIKKWNIATVPFYIIAGMILGPYGLGIHVQSDLKFLGEIGLLFLVFLAGLEIYETKTSGHRMAIKYAIISGTISFVGGFTFGYLMGYPVISSLLIGTILISSSVAEIINILNTTPSLKQKFGDFLTYTIVILDSTSMILLGIVAKLSSPQGELVIFFIFLALFLLFSIYVLPSILSMYFNRKSRKPREGDVKFILAVLMGVVAVGHIIGVHGVVSAFIVGMIMGKYIPSEDVYRKIHSMAYGFMVPVFFVVLGMEIDLSIVITPTGILMPILLVLVLITVKLLGGLVFGHLTGKSMSDSILLGILLWPQLSATLAATAIGFELGIFDTTILFSAVIMAIFSAIVTPFVVSAISGTDSEVIDIEDHVVIIGYGRTSSKITYLLKTMNVPTVVIDRDPRKVKELADAGYYAICGAGEDSRILYRAAVDRARMTFISIPEDHAMYVAAREIKRMNPSCHIIVKVNHERQLRKLMKEHLIDEYIWPEKISSHHAVQKVMEALSE